ncbi:piggyBac transposable element-derived protein 3-like [Eurosta solidaginis]|uniref:piggyBac transposable element-derived protein 3-like n=1 Tax=Eurosta solidaginis TaxID=178769 RepID=UPI003531042E
MDEYIIGGKRYNADEVADMLCDDFEDQVGSDIPKDGNVSFDEDEPEDAFDDLMDETPGPKRIRNQAENDYELLDEDSISDSVLQKMNDDDANGSMLEASNVTIPDNEPLPVDLSIVRQEPSSPPKKRRSALSTPLTLESTSSQEAKHQECCRYKDIVIDIASTDFERARWRKCNLQLSQDQICFLGGSVLKSDQTEKFSTPYGCFKYFFTDELMEIIVNETITYAKVEKNNQTFFFDIFEFGKFIGITYYMSYHKLPCVRDYWNKQNGVDAVRNVMTVNRYEKIKEYLHMNNNSAYDEENPDRLYKLRPVLNYLNERFQSIPMQSRLSIDEQICSTKAGHFMKQYLPNKPKKWGFKFFALCDVSGFMYMFEIYTGETHCLLPGEPDLKASANIVVRMTRGVPRFQNYIIYMDNYYTSIPLLIYLRTQGIHSIGTINRNRIKNCKLPETKDMMKMDRGVSAEFLTTIYGIPITSISWKDNRVVNLVSTFVGMKPVLNPHIDNVVDQTIQRWDKKEKKVITISCPQIIKEYNMHMGGVDLMDSHLGRLKIVLKSRKWYLRIFYHLLDICMVNAWLLFKRSNPSASMTQKAFRLEICYVLTNMGTNQNRSGVHTIASRVQDERGPPKNLRFDGIHHYPLVEGRARCKNETCNVGDKNVNNRSIFKWEKCNVHLCLNDKRNCFVAYHKK